MTDSTRSCFIIGPMKDMDLGENARLKLLANQVIKPLFDDIRRRTGIEYIVRTPYDLKQGHILNDVIFEIDRADIVVADLTDSNPNVFYELGICHSLGRPCLAVMESRQQKVEFDIAAYRVYKINIEGQQFAEARDTLREPLEHLHEKVSDWSNLENPVIDFFRAPVTYISPAFALAEGYFKNFVRPVVEAMIRMRVQEYIYDVGYGLSEQPVPRKLDGLTLLPREKRTTLKLHIIVPNRIDYCKHIYVDKMRQRIFSAVVEGDGRTYTCFSRDVTPQQHALVDIPTTIAVLEDAVDRRMRERQPSRQSKEWQRVEEQELDRFVLNLGYFIERHQDNPLFKNRIEILRYNPDMLGGMLWLHNIFFE